MLFKCIIQDYIIDLILCNKKANIAVMRATHDNKKIKINAFGFTQVNEK